MASLDEVIDSVVLRIRRGDSSAARALRDVYKWALYWNVPQSRLTKPLYSVLFRAHNLYAATREVVAAKTLYEPMLRARVEHAGARLQVTALPYIVGHTRISIGDDCSFGYFTVSSGRFHDAPELRFGNNVSVGQRVRFVVNERITIGNHVGIAPDCWLADSDAHPTDPDAREAGSRELSVTDIKPVSIEDYAWLGFGAKVLKGVTVGRGAVVAAGSVVASDVPPGALAMGVPARMLKRPW